MHIDNRLITGIDENDVFLNKTTAAIDGSKLIIASKIDEDIKLFRAYIAQRSGVHHLLFL